MAAIIEDARRRVSEARRPALLELCAVLDEGLPSAGDELARVIADGARLELAAVGGASIAPDAVGLAAYDGDGRLKQANELFRACVDTDEGEIDALRRRAEAHGRAIGMVPARDGGMVCLLALSRPTARQWPILADSVAGDLGAVAMLVLSPSRSSDSFKRAASAAGLTELERKLAQALLEEETLEDAAQVLGIKRETAKSTMARATRRMNSNSVAELLGVLVDLSCAPVTEPDDEAATVQQLLGLTQAEARVALALSKHGSRKDAARAVGSTPETIKTHQRAIFAKLGVHRNRTLRRLVTEALALNDLASLAEVRWRSPAHGNRLRLLFRDGRRLALVDYGPRRATPVFVGHGDTTGGLLPDGLVRALQERDLRPVSLQRPGFGLTAEAKNGFLADAAADMAFVLDVLKAEKAHLLMRDGGVAAALEFARHRPRRVASAVLQNPRQPTGAMTHGNNPLAALQRHLRLHPMLLEPLGEVLRRQSHSDFLKAIVRHVGNAVPADKALIADGKVLDTLVSDMHGMISLTAAGFVGERRVFSDGWQPPAGALGGQWTVAWSGGLFADAVRSPWLNLPGVRFVTIEHAGTFVQYTHPEALVRLFER